MNQDQIVRLSSVIKIMGGGTPQKSKSEYWGGDILWLSVSDFNNGYRWVEDTEDKITESGLRESNTKLLNSGDIILSARGTVGAISQLRRPMAFNQTCYGIRGLDGVSDTSFI